MFQPTIGPARRLLVLLTRRPPWSRFWSVAVVVATMAAINTLDLLVGSEISLRPLYYVPIALAVAWLGWRAAVLFSIACTTAWLSVDYYTDSIFVVGANAWWNGVIALSTFLLVAGMLHTLLGLHREMEQRVLERTASLQEALAGRERLQREILQIAARERTSIGRDLHDGLCQHLTATALAAQLLAERAVHRGESVAGDARTVVHLLQQGITQTREIASGLLLAAIEPQRLAQELSDFASDISRQTGVPVHLQSSGDAHAPDGATAAQLFRIAQEAVRNAVKHAKATHIDILLKADPNDFTLTVLDNGHGMALPARRPGGMGLQIMEHRAASIDAHLAMESVEGGGTRVTCRLATESHHDGR
jgi:signal transduction histidine kinase